MTVVTTVPPNVVPGPPPSARVGGELFSFDQAVDVIVRPSTGQAYVVGRLGTVQPVQGLDGSEPKVGAAVLDVRRELTPNFEEGLLAATFDPDGTHLYVNLVSGGTTRIVEMPVAADGTVDAAARRVLFEIAQPDVAHNGGSVLFGPDGMLYVFLGDGGLFEEPRRIAQDLTSPLGKILRIDPSSAADGRPYTIPADNPFVGVEGALPEIWAYGVRNPWRASFDRETGDLWFGDVGEYFYEEVDLARAVDGGGRGLSFGWPAWEGPAQNDQGLDPAGHEPPLYTYEHGDLGCSVSGGQVYRGTRIPSLVGWYVFGDYCSGTVWALEGTGTNQLVELGNVPNVVSIGTDADGELYAVSVLGGVHRIEPAG
jgi:glucose/arabinose dehydrogenase